MPFDSSSEHFISDVVGQQGSSQSDTLDKYVSTSHACVQQISLSELQTHVAAQCLDDNAWAWASDVGQSRPQEWECDSFQVLCLICCHVHKFKCVDLT